LVTTLIEQQNERVKMAHRKGLTWGAIGGAALAVLIGVLI
jgi:high-affinity Fe2+/Pb2+ permease